MFDSVCRWFGVYGLWMYALKVMFDQAIGPSPGGLGKTITHMISSDG